MSRPTLPLFPRLLLALSIALAPTLPALATVAKAGEGHGAHAGHATHMAEKAIDADDASSQEDDCHDRCCLACAPYFADIVAPFGDIAFARSVQTSVVKRYHSHTLISPPDRPPRVL